MRRLLVPTTVIALALASFAQADTPTPPTATSTAEQLCRAERGTTAVTRAAFAQKYGTNKNHRNAFGKCVSKQTAAQEDQAQAAKQDAQTACTTERGTTAESQAAFAQKYGTNKNGRNAFGKCVSQKATAADHQNDAAELSAAKSCATERGTTKASVAAFAQKYGTNKNHRNAFGKCVSQKAASAPQS